MVSIAPRPHLKYVAAVVVAGFALAGVAADADAKRKRRRRSRVANIAPLTRDGLPNVQSDSALVVDTQTGDVLYERNPDKVRAIASTGKIFVALVVRRMGMDLDGETEITEIDRALARGGARTRLPVGHKFKNIDLLKAMLIASDNRAPSALGRAVGLSPKELIARMNTLALELGLTRTTFTDTSGLRGNESTARDMAVALRAALADEVLAELMTLRQATIKSIANRPRAINYTNTNKALHQDRYNIQGGKTGYTEAAGYCLVVGAKIDGTPVACVFLGGVGKLTRFGDFNRVGAWIQSRNNSSPLASGGDSGPAVASP